MIRLGIAAIAALACVPPAMAQDHFEGSGAHSDMDCGGKGATITGASNEMTVTGHCQSLVIEGAGNIVHVAMAKGGTIRITGASNEVYWTTPDGTRPRVNAAGAGNSVVKVK